MNPNIDISKLVLQTPRLTLRAWDFSDLADFFHYASNPKVGPMAGWIPHKSQEDSREILDSFIKHHRCLALVYRETGSVIGSLEIQAYPEKDFPELENYRCCELGFVLAADYWGQGLMPEALEAVMIYLFNELHLDYILCGHFLWNEQSARVQEKLGFKPYRLLCNRLMSSGRYEDIQITLLNREDFLDSKLC